MNGGEGRRPRARRRLTAEETALWHGVTKSVKPLRSVLAPEAASPPPEAEPPPPPGPPVAAPPPASPRRAAKAPPASPLAPLAPLGRRLTQRLGRGTAFIDARLDLHGMTQDRAHAALLRFLRTAQAREAQVVLVITGKGARPGGEDGRGVLNRVVPQWLGLPEFRAYVVGFESAQPGHGGAGALYVRVRRAR